MLASETDTLGEVLDSLDAEIDALEEYLEELDEDTDNAEAARDQRDRLTYFRNGVAWHAADPDADDVDRDDAWGPGTEVTIGALTAGEKAMMHREIPDGAGDDEHQLWYVAAATEAGPYVEDELTDTFSNVVGLHPAFVDWIEARSNALGVAGNRSGTSSTDSESSGTSTPTPDSTT